MSATHPIPKKSALAVAVTTALSGQTDSALAQGAEEQGLEEIIVTARKRSESLQDVSASIQAFSGDDLEKQGLNNIEDVIRFLPSVSHLGGTSGANKIIFRGVSDNPGAFIAASSAALYIDEQPLTQFSINPEPRFVDIERVEALPGPQGTLYGDSSQSGTLRIITNRPELDEFSARVEVTGAGGPESSASHDFNVVLNIPVIEDKFAIRLVGFDAHDGGFVDNVFGVSPMRGTKDNSALVGDDINGVDHSGGRVSARWQINDEWVATVSGIYQNTEANARNDFDPTVGDLQTIKFFRDTRGDEWSQGALTIEGSFGNFDLVSSTSYFDRDIDYVFDRTTYSAYFNYNFCPYYATYCWSGTAQDNQDTVGFNTLDQDNQRFTQELRISQSADNYNWVLGAFYEKKTEYWEYRAITPEFTNSLSYATWTYYYAASGVDPSWWLSVDDTQWDQWAVFGNFSYDFNETWSAEVGLRYFDQDQDRRYFVDKPFILAPNVWPDIVNPQGGNSDVVPKASLTYRFDDERLIYALYSEGFRAGGINRNRTPNTIFPSSYQPDLLSNFEVGTKTRWLDGRLQINATAYFMQWDDYQIEVIDPSNRPCDPGEVPDVDLCGQPFQVVVANVGDAEQLGLELDIQAAPTENLDLGVSMAFIDAETAQTFEVITVVPEGTRLPNVPEFKFNAFAEYNWPVEFVTGANMYARLQYSYQSDSRSQLEEFPEAPRLTSGTPTRIQDAYGIADFKIGLVTDSWEVQAFVNNITDERAEIYNDVFFHDTFFGRDRLTTNRPLEAGVRFSYRWE